MPLTYQRVKDIILDELRSKGYSPNPADVHLSATQIMAELTEDLKVAAGESLDEVKKLASAGAPLIQPPAK